MNRRHFFALCTAPLLVPLAGRARFTGLRLPYTPYPVTKFIGNTAAPAYLTDNAAWILPPGADVEYQLFIYGNAYIEKGG